MKKQLNVTMASTVIALITGFGSLSVRAYVHTLPHSLAWGRKVPSYHSVSEGGTVRTLACRTIKPSEGDLHTLSPFRFKELDGRCS